MADVCSATELKPQKNSSKLVNNIITSRSCGTNTLSNFMCNNCIRKIGPYRCASQCSWPSPHVSSNCSSHFLYGDSPYKSEKINAHSEECGCCENSRINFSRSENSYFRYSSYNPIDDCCRCNAGIFPNQFGGFFSPFPIYMPFYYNPAQIFTNNQTYCVPYICCSSTQTDSCQSEVDICSNKSLPKLNYNPSSEIENLDQCSNKETGTSKTVLSEDNVTLKNDNEGSENCDNTNESVDEEESDESETSEPSESLKKNKLIRICEENNSYYELGKQLERKNSSLKFDSLLAYGDELRYYSATSLQISLNKIESKSSQASNSTLDGLLTPTNIQSNESFDLQSKVTCCSLNDESLNFFDFDESDEFDEIELDDQSISIIKDDFIAEENESEIDQENSTELKNLKHEETRISKSDETRNFKSEDTRNFKKINTPKFSPPQMDSAHKDSAAICMLSLLTRHKTIENIPQMNLTSPHPQTNLITSAHSKSEGGRVSVLKKSNSKEKTSENYPTSLRGNIHKLPSALQQNDALKSSSPRTPVKLRKNPNLNTF